MSYYQGLVSAHHIKSSTIVDQHYESLNIDVQVFKVVFIHPRGDLGQAVGAGVKLHRRLFERRTKYMTDCVHILAVSEHSSRSYEVARMLCRLGFEISQAQTVTEALHAAEDYPDLVLLEVDLPVTDVEQICGALKANYRTSEIPVVLYSATSHASTAAQVEELGATSFLFCPIDQEELSVVIRGALARQRCREAHHHIYGHNN